MAFLFMSFAIVERLTSKKQVFFIFFSTYVRYTVSIMLQLSNALSNQSVLSLRTGTPVAMLFEPIINPNNLKIEGFYCQDSISKQTLVLLPQDIRDILPQGFVVNDHDVLVEPADLVRLKSVLDLGFELLGKPVVTSSGEKLGKVNDYSTETTSMVIQKLYVSQSIFKNFSGGNLGIDRSQITEITDKKIVVQDTSVKITQGAQATA